jgi:hypothetical protein
MRYRDHSPQAKLINLRSNVFEVITLPNGFGMIGPEELAAEYNWACMNLPPAYIDAATHGPYSHELPWGTQPLPPRPVRPDTTGQLRGGQYVCAFLHDQIVFLKAIIEEIYQIQDRLSIVLGGFDTDEIDTYELVGLGAPLPLPPQLNPTSAYYLRAMVRFRLAMVDFKLVSRVVESVLGTIDQVIRGVLAPAVRTYTFAPDELVTQHKAWETLFLEVSMDFFELESGFGEKTLFYRDMESIRSFQKAQTAAWAHQKICSR